MKKVCGVDARASREYAVDAHEHLVAPGEAGDEALAAAAVQLAQYGLEVRVVADAVVVHDVVPCDAVGEAVVCEGGVAWLEDEGTQVRAGQGVESAAAVTAAIVLLVRDVVHGHRVSRQFPPVLRHGDAQGEALRAFLVFELFYKYY